MSKTATTTDAVLSQEGAGELSTVLQAGPDGNTPVQAKIACQPAGSNDLYFDTRGPKGELIIGNIRYKPGS